MWGTLYLVPVLCRLQGSAWLDGTASWIALVDPTTSRVASFMASTGRLTPTSLLYLITYVTML